MSRKFSTPEFQYTMENQSLSEQTHRVFFKTRLLTSLLVKLPAPVLFALAPKKLMIPYYHLVSDEDILHVKHLYAYKNTKQFLDDIEYLSKNYNALDLSDVLRAVNTGSKIPDNSFLLTFDDGFREMHDVVAPILLRKGIPAAFFVTTAFIDNKCMYYRQKASILANYLSKSSNKNLLEKIKGILLNYGMKQMEPRKQLLSVNYHNVHILDEIAQHIGIDFNEYMAKHKPYLTSDQIKILIKKGFAIGSHSIDHLPYSTLSIDDQLFQTEYSTKAIRDQFGLRYGAFAFPLSDAGVSQAFFTKLYANGIVDISFGTNHIPTSCFPNNFRRFSLEKPLLPAQSIIALHSLKSIFKFLKQGYVIGK